MGPLVPAQITTSTKAESSNQFLLLNKPELDLPVAAAAGQPPIRQHGQGIDLATMREDSKRKPDQGAPNNLDSIRLQRAITSACDLDALQSQSASAFDRIRGSCPHKCSAGLHS